MRLSWVAASSRVPSGVTARPLLPELAMNVSKVAGGVALGEVWGRRDSGSKAGLADLLIAGLEPVHPGAVHAVAGGELGHRLLLDD